MRNIRHCDVTMGEKDGEATITIFHHKSKTDQAGVGRVRSLAGWGGDISSIGEIMPWIRHCKWGPRSTERLFRGDIYIANAHDADKVRGIRPWNPTRERSAAPSLRSGGGASAMFVECVSFRDIKLLGVWSCSAVQIYLLHDDATYK